MEAGTLGVKKIFSQDRRHVVPLFQRPYVWSQADQWEPLWDDLRNTAERLQRDEDLRYHFLGAIVLDQLPQPTGKMETRLVVDGQQRLTTIQIFLEAFCDLCLSLGAEKHHKALLKLTRNDDPMSEDEDEVFKVWPTNVDQHHFRSVMNCQTPEELRKAYDSKGEGADIGHPIADGYLYFHGAVEQWLGDAMEEQEERLDALLNTMRDYVRLVVIDLSAEDDAQLIFETLNARGTPLLPSDLVKNFLFHLAQKKGLDIGKLYKNRWEHFDARTEYWRKLMGRGHAQRARMDLFLLYYLAVQSESDVQVTHLYVMFRDFANRHGDPEVVLASVKEFADIFQRFETFPRGSREGYFFERIDALRQFLTSSESESGRWPADEEFMDEWVNNPIYKILTQQRTRMILEALELGLRTEKSEKLQLDEKLTIEHIMPQNWQSHWPLDGAEEQRRNRVLHSIGNLTLINTKLNPSISNGAWATKRDGLADHSLMRLNQKLMELGEWNEDQIRARAEALCEVAKKV